MGISRKQEKLHFYRPYGKFCSQLSPCLPSCVRVSGKITCKINFSKLLVSHGK